MIVCALVHRFGANTNHLVLNDRGSPVVFEGVYKIQAMLNLLHPGIFPLLPHQRVQVGYFFHISSVEQNTVSLF